MLLQLIKFEWFYNYKQISFIVCIASFMGFGLLMMISLAEYLEGSTMVNDGYNLTLLSGIISIGLIVPIMILTNTCVLRDNDYLFAEIVYSTGVNKSIFFFSRFIGILINSLLIGILALFGIWIGSNISSIDQELMHSFELQQYIRPFAALIVPNIICITSILYSTAILSMRSFVVYIVGIFIFLMTAGALIFINSPLTGGAILASQEYLKIGTFIDLLGLVCFFEQTQFITPIEKNEYLLVLTDSFRWNRILVFIIATLSILISYKFFGFRKLDRRSRIKKKQGEQPTQKHKYQAQKIMLSGNKSKWLTFRSLWSINIRKIFFHFPFMLVLAAWVVMLLLSFENSIVGIHIFGDRYPTTDLLVGNIFEVLPVLGLFLIVYFGGELVWSSRTNRIYEIIDSTPVNNSLLYISTLAALMSVPLILIILSIATSIIYQLFSGYYQFDINQYLSIFYFSGLQFLLHSIFVLFIQSQVRHKVLGILLSGSILLIFSSISQSIGIEHPLLQFNNLPDLSRAWSDFTGYGRNVTIFNTYFLYWGALSFILLVVTTKLWKRGMVSQNKSILSKFWTGKEKAIIISSLVIFIILGGNIFYKLNVQDGYISSQHRYDFNEKYELRYKKYSELPVPQLVSVKTTVDIYAKERRYAVVADCQFANRTERPITELFITHKVPVETFKLEGGELIFHDEELNVMLFTFSNAILPDEQRKMTYELIVKDKNLSTSNSINTNGSYIRNTDFSPYLGYVDAFEIDSEYERKVRGLAPLLIQEINDDHLQLAGKFNYEKIEFETVISTDMDQTGICSGELVRNWDTDGRQYFHYKSENRISSTLAYFSARYMIVTEQYKDIDIQVYYNHRNPQNVKEVLKATKATIDYCTEHFGPYPHQYLRIVEMPIFGGGGANGQSMPGVISVNEKVFKRNVEKPTSFNAVARVIVHEVSHQWWGGLLTPKRTEGAMILTESLAKYSELVILEKLYGQATSKQLLEYSQRRYHSGRSNTPKSEPPLYLCRRQQYLGYHKGAIVFSAIRELLGEQALNKALYNLVSKNRAETEATTLDLLNELYAISHKSNHGLIDDWLKKVIDYNMSIPSATYIAKNDGSFEITIKVWVDRYETLPDGTRQDIGIDEPIMFGLMSATSGKDDVRFVELSTRHINSKEKVFTFEVAELPVSVVIDPFFSRLDRKMEDNIILVEKGME